MSELESAIRIKLIGVGGAGSNAVHRLMDVGISDVYTIAANTDKQHLDLIKSHQKILLGPTVSRRHGTGGNPEMGRLAAEESLDEIRAALDGADLVFVTAGLGGGTGTGAAPLVAKAAMDQGSIVVGVVTLPFRFEGAVRRRVAMRGLDELQKVCNTVVIIDNNRLLDLYPQYDLNSAFAVADEVIHNMVLSISESLVKPSLINIDFEDFKAVVSRGRIATIGLGKSSSPNRAEEATFNALQSPLLEGTIDGISAAIVHVSGGEDMKLKDATRPGEIVSELMGEEGLVIWGARVDRRYGSTLHVSLILAGGAYVRGPVAPLLRTPAREEQKAPIARVGSEGASEDIERLLEELGG